MKNQIQSIKKFYKEHTFLFFSTVLITILFYWNHAMSTNIGIDTEQYVLRSYGKDWVIQGLGRFGYYYSTMLLNMWKYNPYVNGVMFLIVFCFAALLWPYVLYQVSGQDKKYSYVLFPIIFLTHPLWAAQFYFSLQQGAIAIGVLLQAISFLLLFDILLHPNHNKFQAVLQIAFSIFCAFWAIGTYQAFPGLHLAEAAACLLVLFDNMMDSDPSFESHKLFWKRTFAVIIHFLTSYLLYQFVCKLMNWGTSNYLQIKWGVRPASKIIRGLWRDFQNILLGKGVYAGWIVLLSLFLFVILAIQMFSRSANIWAKIDYLLLLAGNVICMIALNIVIGGVPADRARLPVAFSAAFLGMYTFSRCSILLKTSFCSVIRIVSALIIVLSLVMQTQRIQTLFYTDDICNIQEYEVGADIVRNIDAAGGGNQSPVVFIGKWDAPLNPSCLQQSPIGVSSFNWDYKDTDPASGTRRSVLYLCAAFGKAYSIVEDDSLKNTAISVSEQMPAYPQEGYVQNVDGLIVVKLSEF